MYSWRSRFGLFVRWHPRFAFVLHASPLCGATLEGVRHNADASEKAKQPNRVRSKHRLTDASENKSHEAKARMPAQTRANQNQNQHPRRAGSNTDASAGA
ncbi:hypothetical protein CUJ88_30300 [Paraburkholderia hospita]|nr:hypothetical protein CUJ88_30300 [Paraburkholderia hospita]OUL70812.1 hypothetical protein CA603_48040 [Paraburkholderia hospita]